MTPPNTSSIHRFFDSSPFSPSGRYLALTRAPLRAEGKPIEPGDVASVVVVDLRRGTERTVATTRGWSSQLGAQARRDRAPGRAVMTTWVRHHKPNDASSAARGRVAIEGGGW